MSKSFQASVGVIMVIAAVSFGSIGCRQSAGCRGGSCPAPSAGYSSPSYGGSSYQGVTSVSPGYAPPSQSYTAPGGSGTRSVPSSGSGTR